MCRAALLLSLLYAAGGARGWTPQHTGWQAGNTDDARAARGCPLRARTWAPPVAPHVAARKRELRRQWAKSGFIVVRGKEWLSGEWSVGRLAAMADEVPRLEQTARGPFHTYEVAKGGVVPSRTEAFNDHHPGWRRFFEGAASPLAAVVNVLARARSRSANATLYKEKINYKRAGGGGYRPHQDKYSSEHYGMPGWKSSRDRGFITYVCMVALDPMHPMSGGPEVSPSVWQKKEGSIHFDKEDWNSQGPYTPVPLDPGDVLVYDNYMPHRSRPNRAPFQRRALFGVYYDSNKYCDDSLRVKYYEDEAKNRRAKGTKDLYGRANAYFMGFPSGPGAARASGVAGDEARQAAVINLQRQKSEARRQRVRSSEASEWTKIAS